MNFPLVHLDAVGVRFGTTWIFSGFSLAVASGEHMALLGANGSGKSTLLRLMRGDLRPPQDDTGRVVWGFSGRQDASPLVARQHARLVSPLQQQTYVRQGWRITGEELVLSGLDNGVMLYGEVDVPVRERARLLAAEAGAEGLLPLQIPAMSQGQLRLLLVIRALVSRPALLLLDEPFEGLDTKARAQVMRLMHLAVAEESGATLVLTAHRKADIPSFVRRVVRLASGTIVADSASGTTVSGGTVTGECAAGGAGGSAAGNTGVCAAGNAGEKGAAFSSLSPRLERLDAPALSPGVAGALPLPLARAGDTWPVARAGVPVLQLTDVDVFIERTQVLFGINWQVKAGEHWVLSGDNGSGKSTLLRLLYGEEFAAWGGSVLWFGTERPALETLYRRVGFVSDRLHDTYDGDISGEDVVISGLLGTVGLYHEPAPAERAYARELMAFLHLTDFAQTSFHAMSSGIGRRFLLARALAASPRVLLLDEPCSGLDPASRALFLDALDALARNGVQLLYVSHHQGDIPAACRHELHLEAGRVVYQGKRR